MPSILMFPHEKIPGWEGPGTLGAQRYRYYPISKFFTVEADSDGMAAAYFVAGEDETYRLNKAALLHAQPMLRWAIFDLDRPGHAAWPNGAEASPEAKAALDAAIAAFNTENLDDLYNTVSGYTTRAGLRLMWQLADGVPATHANSLLRQLGGLVWQVTGLEVDEACYQWNRLFRIPRAYRDGRSLQPYSVSECCEEALDWRMMCEANGFTLTDDLDYGGTPAGEQPDIDEVEVDGIDAPNRPEWMKLGEPVPSDEGGSTYRPLRGALVAIASRYEMAEPEPLYALAYASAMATPKRTSDELWKMCVGVSQWQEQVLGRRAAEEAAPPTSDDPEPDIPDEHWERIAEAVRRARLKGLEAKVFGRWKNNERTAPARYDAARVRELVEASAELLASTFNHVRIVHAILLRSGQDPNHLWALAKAAVEKYRRRRERMDRTDAFLEQHPAVLIYNGDRYWLDTTAEPFDYVRVNGNDYISIALGQFTRPSLPAGVELDEDLPAPRFFEAYGRLLRRRVLVSGARRTTWTPAQGGGLLEAIHPLDVDLEPRHHKDIAEYLHLLGGSDHDLLLDWLSHVTYTNSRALPALLLRGEAGGGKTLLPKGLAKLWGTQPADYNKVTGTAFQSEMRESPLLLADEGIKEKGDWAASFFRQLVTNGTHKASIKHQDEVSIRCFFRVVVTANNDDDDPIPLGRSLGEQGIRAVQQRVLHIEVDEKPGRYLTNKVGAERINSVWLDGNAIAEHVLWLRDNHQASYDPTSRLAVNPRTTPWHNAFAHNQGDKPLTAEVLRKMLQDGRMDSGSPRVTVMNDPQDRQVWVSADAFIEATKILGTRLKNPRDALRKASVKKATEPTRTYLFSSDGTFKLEGKTTRLYRVPWDVLTVNEVMHDDELEELQTVWRRRKA